jgi:hypothetical protein
MPRKLAHPNYDLEGKTEFTPENKDPLTLLFHPFAEWVREREESLTSILYRRNPMEWLKRQ